MATTSPLLEGLNEIQREAVLHTEGPVLIVAGAGSGKTRALTHRIAYLVREQGVSPYEILAITFTNKAAREMAARVERLIGSGIARGMWILTFHSACARILRREHTHLGHPVGVHDLRRRRHRAADRRHPARTSTSTPKRFPPKQLAAAIGKAKDRVISRRGLRHDVLELLRGDRREGLRRLRDAQEGGRRARLRRPDHRDGAAVPRPPRRAAHYQERFRYILVDEYQDTSRAQYELINLLAERYGNVCVVGDADQGVYSWRGATIQNILDFERDYPDAQVFLMEQNYRSTGNILGAANALIEHNVQRKPKTLWTDAGSGELVVSVPRERRARGGAVRRERDRAPARRGGLPLSATSRSSTGRTRSPA